MPYDPNDPNQDSQTDTGRSSSALQGQLENLNHLLATGQITPQQAQQMMPPNTKFDPSSGHFVVNDPMNPWPLIIALSAPLALGWGGGAAGGSAGVVGAAGNEGDAAALAGGSDAAAAASGGAAYATAPVDLATASAGPSSVSPETTLLGSTPGAAVPSTTAATTATTAATDTLPLTGPGSVGYVEGPGISAMQNPNGLPDWLNLAKDLNNPLTALATGQAEGRNADNIANIGFANAQNNLYNSELSAPGKIASNAVRGDILSNARDVSIAAPSDIPVPTISGGLRPSMFSDTTRQLGKDITANAAATPMPVATPPTLQPFESAGNGTDILNAANTITGLTKPGYDIWKLFNNG